MSFDLRFERSTKVYLKAPSREGWRFFMSENHTAQPFLPYNRRTELRGSRAKVVVFKVARQAGRTA